MKKNIYINNSNLDTTVINRIIKNTQYKNLSSNIIDNIKKTNENKLINNTLVEKKNEKYIDNDNLIVNNLLAQSMMISYDYLLNIYEINNTDDLLKIVLKLINEDKNFSFIDRIINGMIRLNYINLKKNNEILVDIYFIIFTKYFNYLVISKNKFNKHCKKYINKWFKNNDNNSFFINLAIDLKKFLSIKYERYK